MDLHLARRMRWLIGMMLACAALAPPARADTLITLQGISFADGGTGSGTFSLNVNGFVAPPLDITTTAGSSFGGYFYGPSALNDYNHGTPSVIDFFSPNFAIDLHLVFADPLYPSPVYYDPLVLGGASYECSDFSCTGSTQRVITAGFALIPEPASLASLLLGSCALGLVRRRQQG